MKKRHCEADGFENSKVGPRDGTPDPPKKLSLVLPMSFPLQTVHSRYLSCEIQTFERKTTNATLSHEPNKNDPTRNTAKENSPPYRLFGRLPGYSYCIVCSEYGRKKGEGILFPTYSPAIESSCHMFYSPPFHSLQST